MFVAIILLLVFFCLIGGLYQFLLLLTPNPVIATTGTGPVEMSLTGYIIRICCVVFILLFFYAIYRIIKKMTLPMMETSYIQGENTNIVTKIPVIKETAQERLYYAFSSIARNLALADQSVDQRAQAWLELFLKHHSKHLLPSEQVRMPLSLSESEPASSIYNLPLSTPTVQELLNTGELGPGKQLILGFADGKPVYGSLRDLKSMAITGLQGSGKTLSVAFFVASAVLAYTQKNIQCYIFDPHQKHPEGLSTYLTPLIERKLIQSPSIIDFEAQWQRIADRVKQRISGQESSEEPILIVADELGAQLRQRYQGTIVKILEQLTEEARKTNIVLMAISHKWTATSFKGHADIRRNFNSFLLHRTQIDTARLLLGDIDRALKVELKKIHNPGSGLLIQDCHEPVYVQMPLLKKEDVTLIAEKVSHPEDFRRAEMAISLSKSPRQQLEENILQEQLPKILDSPKVSQQIREFAENSGYTLKEMYQHIFGNDESLKEATFLTKVKNRNRPWKPDEMQRIQHWIHENPLIRIT
jgi:hypothetical protein